jgi:argininosuccinate synthase
MHDLNELGVKHGIGRVDIVENRLVGMKSRGVYETPGGTILYKAHAALEQLCLDKMTLHYKQELGLRYAELVYNGQWYTPLRKAMDSFVQTTEENITGTVRLKLYKGNVILAGRKSPTASTARTTSPLMRTMSITRPMLKASSASSVCP